MNDKPQTNIACFGIKAETKIGCKYHRLMERMKTYAAAAGVVYWIG
jgi:hypothetical protein